MSRALRIGSLAGATARHITPEILAAAVALVACPPRAVAAAGQSDSQVIRFSAANVDTPCAKTASFHAPRMFHG